MRHRLAGFSIVELVIVVAIAGVLLAVGLLVIPRDGFALNQATEGLIADSQLARFEAISRAAYVRLSVEPDSNQYRLLQVTWNDLAQAWDEDKVLKVVDIGDNRTQRIGIASANSANDLIYDPRGNPIGLGVQTVQFQSVRGRTATVTISQQGRATR